MSFGLAASLRPREGAFLRWPTKRSREWVGRFLLDAELDENLRAVVAVGSAIRPNVESQDVDLVVLCDAPQLFRVTSPLEVDLRAYAYSTAATQVIAGHDLLGWTLKFGKPLHQKKGAWDRLIRSFPEGPPFPDTSRSFDRAEKARGHAEDLLSMGDEDAAREQVVSYLTHVARAALVRAGVYPASRPELPSQLRAISRETLSSSLEDALRCPRASAAELLARLGARTTEQAGRLDGSGRDGI